MTGQRFVPAYEVVEAPGARAGRTIFFLHGILGSRRNWLSFARRVVEAVPEARAVLVDLRNHGESHGAPPPHTLEACAEDLAELGAELGEEPRVVVGHSFGGKVALVYARDFAAALEHAWILDAPPGPRSFAGASEVERVIAAVRAVKLPVPGRKELVDELLSRGLARPIAQWMTTNLRPDERGGFSWRFDLDAIEPMLESFGAQDLWPFCAKPPSGLSIHLVRAGRSDRWTDRDLAELEALSSRGAIFAHVIEGAGHWVHTDAPDALFEGMAPTF